jgi:Type II restriction endonuclease EcoO109I
MQAWAWLFYLKQHGAQVILQTNSPMVCPMSPDKQQELLDKASDWFRDVVMTAHINNTKKLASAKKFKVNPFLHHYLAAFLTGEVTPQSLAQVLILPRVLGTSITTSFGTQIQKFVTEVLQQVIGSTASGIDIEFIDTQSGQKTYMQVKLGPSTINKDDVETIHQHFQAVRRLAKTNNAKIGTACLAVGVMYGEHKDLSANYKALEDKHGYALYTGQDFWFRLTGSETFYDRLIAAIANVAVKADSTKLLSEVEAKLAKQLSSSSK